MASLTADQIDELRRELERQRSKLEQSMQVTDQTAAPVKLDQTAVGRLSRIDSLQNQGLARNLQEREQVKLALIERALGRIEQGSYGLCELCGAPVPFERLYVFPEAPTCAGCGAG